MPLQPCQTDLRTTAAGRAAAGAGVAVLALALLANDAGAASRAPALRQAERAAAGLVAGPARFRGLAVHGDVVCGEVQGRAGGYRPFFAYDQKPGWTAHASTDGLARAAGLACFDGETGLKGKGAPACRGYDFDFYFAYDHFCR